MQTYTVKEVAEILGYSTNSIYTFLKEKRIKGVRIGHGRFRISEEELAQLMHLAKKPLSNHPASSNMPSTPSTILLPAPTTGVSQPFAPHQTNHAISIAIPSLFDWFLGVASILVGISMLLLNRYPEEYAIGQYVIFINPIRISLIAAGLGILLSDMLGKVKSVWDILFHILLAFLYCAFALILLEVGDFDGFTIYGLAGLVQVVSLFIGLGNVVSFALFASLFFLFLPIAIFLKTPSYLLSSSLAFVSKNNYLAISVWIGIGLLFILLIWWAYYRKRLLFFLLMGVSTIALIVLSIFYAVSLFWGRAFFLLFMAICMMFAPFWSYLQLGKPKDRLIIFIGHGLVLVIFLSAMGIVRLIQSNTLSYIKEQLQNKVDYGRVLVETAFESTTQSLENTATNPMLVEALKTDRKDLISGIARNIFEGNRNFQRIIVLSANGDLESIYPPMQLETTNFAFRDYFKKALDEKKTYISDLYQIASADKVRTIVLSTPIATVNATPSGVLVGSIDLDFLGVRLQQIANATQQEYFAVIDASGMRILHPNQALVNTELDQDDVLRNALNGEKGAQGYNASGTYVVAAYDHLSKLGWTIAAIQPLNAALTLTNTTTFIVFFVMLASVIVLSTVVWFRARIRPKPKDTS